MSQHVVAVDIGNNTTHVGLIDTEKWSCLKREEFPTAQAQNRLIAAIGRAAGDLPVRVAISTVVKPLQARLDALLRKSTYARPEWVGYHPDLAVKITYDKPQLLGADRIANLLYAQAAFPGKSAIIIDSGTTINIECLKDGREFIGGAILPGAALQFKALHRGTSELPETALDAPGADRPGTSTAACIRTGVLAGIAGALDRLVQSFKTQLSSECVVLATGGAWHAQEKLVTFGFQLVKDLTLIGVGVYGATRK
jgi:type III pantothenate kinase